VLGVRAGDTMVDYLPSTVQSLAGTIIGRGLLSERELTDSLADCRAHLRGIFDDENRGHGCLVRLRLLRSFYRIFDLDEIEPLFVGSGVVDVASVNPP